MKAKKFWKQDNSRNAQRSSVDKKSILFNDYDRVNLSVHAFFTA